MILPLQWEIILLLMVLALTMGGVWFFKDQHKSQKASVEANLLAIARLKAHQIGEWRLERLSDAAIVAGRRALIASIDRYLTAPDASERAELIRRLGLIKSHYHMADILVVDRENRVRLTLDENEPGLCEDFYPVLTKALALKKPMWTPIHRESESTPLHLSVVTPLFDEADTHAIGALIMVCDVHEFLFPLIQSWPIPSMTAETLLVRRDKDEVVFLNDLRHTEDAALNLRIPVSRTDLPAAMAVTGVQGIVRGRDYRGEKVLAAILPVPESPWFMVAKMDESEAFAEWRFRSAVIIIFLVIGVGLMLAVAFLIHQRNRKWHYRNLYQSEAELSSALERHRITLAAIGDAVISTDEKGNVALMNPVAEQLTGWSQAEAKGKHLVEIFRIINESTRKPMADPVAKVLAAKKVVGLANHTLLIRKDGSEIPISDSGSPIKDRHGNITGVVLVFNDQSEQRRYQKTIIENEAKYRLLADNTLDVIWVMNMDLVFTYVNPAIKTMTGYEPEEWIGTKLYEHCEEAPLAKMTAVIAEEVARGPEQTGIVFETEMIKKDGSPLDVEIHGRILFDENDNPTGLQGTALDIAERLARENENRSLQAQLIQAQKMESVGRLAGGVAHDYNNMLGVIIGYAELALDKIAAEDPLYMDLNEILSAGKRSAEITRQLLAFARKQTIAPKILDVNETIESMLKMLRRLIGEDIDLAWHPGKDIRAVKMDPSQIDQMLANLCVNARDAIQGVGKVTIETQSVTLDEDYCAGHAGFIPGDYTMIGVSDNGQGMEKETLDMVFEPFFTTKATGEGTGLGLAMVYGVVKQNEGFINVYSEVGKGTTFKIYLPCESALENGKKVKQETDVPLSQGETLLLVEDEAAILKLGKKMLVELGYSVIVSHHPTEALHLAEAHRGNIALMITDVVMPVMNGQELARKMLNFYPDLKILFMSGYTANVIAHRGVLDEGVHFLQKPFSKKQLAEKIREVLEA